VYFLPFEIEDIPAFLQLSPALVTACAGFKKLAAKKMPAINETLMRLTE